MLDRALAQLTEIAGRDRRAAAAHGRLEQALHSLAEPIEPRAAAALVHGELGPDHVLLDRRGEPVDGYVPGIRAARCRRSRRCWRRGTGTAVPTS